MARLRLLGARRQVRRLPQRGVHRHAAVRRVRENAIVPRTGVAEGGARGGGELVDAVLEAETEAEGGGGEGRGARGDGVDDMLERLL